MLENVGDILRYCTYSPLSEVTLETEIENTKRYIEILKIRYRDKFDVIWEYNKDILNIPIIKLIFQPLVENAVYHGIKESNQAEKIKIKLFIREDELHMYIINTGVGITKEKLLQLREMIKVGDPMHVGLYNINQRLMLVYEKDYIFDIRSKKEVGTCICIKIPTYK